MRWEYWTEIFPHENLTADAFDARLDELGDEGWEMFFYDPNNRRDDEQVIFTLWKRSKE